MPEDTDKKEGPEIGSHRQPQAPAPQQEAQQPAQQAWVPAKPGQQAPAPEQQPAVPAPAAWVSAKPGQMAAAGQQAAAAEPAIPKPEQKVAVAAEPQVGGDSKSPAKPKAKPGQEDDEEMSASEKLKAGAQGILAGNGGSKEGKLIGEAVGEGIKSLFGQGGKDGAGKPKVQASAEAPKEEGPVAGAHRKQEAAKQEGPEAGGLDVGGSIGKKIGGMIGSAIGGDKGKSVGQMLGKVVGGAAGQAANLAVDHSRGIGGGIGGAIGGVIGGDKGAAVGKDLGKGIGSAVKSVRDALASQGVQLGPKQAPGKQGHSIK